MNAPIPLRPDPDAVDRAFVRSFVRAGVCSMNSAIDRTQTAEFFARKAYPHDGDIPRFLKNSVTPNSTSDSASALVAQSMALMQALVPVSAGAGLLRETFGMLSWDAGVGVISAPTLDMTSALPTWVQEGQPHRVPQGISSKVSLTPHRWETSIPFTSEMLAQSNADIQVQRSIVEGVGYALDQSLFSGNAAVPGLSPAGLLWNVPQLTPSAASFAWDAMVADLSALAAAVSMVAGNGAICFICSPAQATAVKIRAPELEYPVLSCAALPEGTAIAVATAAIVFASGGPNFETSRETTVHFEDTSPSPISSPGTPNVVAAPVMSAWQADLVMYKFRWVLDWALRTKPAQPNGPPQGVACVSGTKW